MTSVKAAEYLIGFQSDKDPEVIKTIAQILKYCLRKGQQLDMGILIEVLIKFQNNEEIRAELLNSINICLSNSGGADKLSEDVEKLTQAITMEEISFEIK